MKKNILIIMACCSWVISAAPRALAEPPISPPSAQQASLAKPRLRYIWGAQGVKVMLRQAGGQADALVGQLPLGGDKLAAALGERFLFLAIKGAGVVIIDCADPRTLAVVARIDEPQVERLALVDERLIVSRRTGGAVSYDVHDPLAPGLLGTYEFDRRLPLVFARAKYDHGRREVTASLPLLLAGLPFTIAATTLLVMGTLGKGEGAGESMVIGSMFLGPGLAPIAAGGVLLVDGLVRMRQAEEALEPPPPGQRYELPEDSSHLRRWRRVGIANLLAGVVAAPVGVALVVAAPYCSYSCYGALFPTGLTLSAVGAVTIAVGGALLIDTHLRSRWQRHLKGLAVSPSTHGAMVHASLRF